MITYGSNLTKLLAETQNHRYENTYAIAFVDVDLSGLKNVLLSVVKILPRRTTNGSLSQ